MDDFCTGERFCPFQVQYDGHLRKVRSAGTPRARMWTNQFERNLAREGCFATCEKCALLRGKLAEKAQTRGGARRGLGGARRPSTRSSE